jgi:predicted transposase YdaD
MAREEGREEGGDERAREIATKLKSSGMDAAAISELTRLTVDDVAEL